jgi:ribosomal protein L37AE/L43A
MADSKRDWEMEQFFGIHKNDMECPHCKSNDVHIDENGYWECKNCELSSFPYPYDKLLPLRLNDE